MSSSASQKQNAVTSRYKEHESLSNTNLVVTSLAAGAIAGALAKTSIAPFDRCKITFQISNQPYCNKAAYHYLRNVYKTDGFFALWRGNSATMARILPYASIQFTAHEQWKRVLNINSYNPSSDIKDVKYRRFLAGSLAGVTSQSLTYPLDLARARMAVTQKEKYASLAQVFRKTFRDEGVRGMYRGYVPTVLGVIPYAGASFFTYETLKQWYSDNTKGKNPGTMERLAFGACSGVCGQTLSYPLDIVRRRMQTAVITGHHYQSILGCLKTIYREEGVRRGFFKGLSMNWIKGPIATGISFATYDRVRDFLRDVVS